MLDIQQHEERNYHGAECVGEQHRIAFEYLFDEEARHGGSDYLRRHGGGIIISGIFAYVAAFAHFPNYREGVYYNAGIPKADNYEKRNHKRAGGS